MLQLLGLGEDLPFLSQIKSLVLEQVRFFLYMLDSPSIDRKIERKKERYGDDDQHYPFFIP